MKVAANFAMVLINTLLLFIVLSSSVLSIIELIRKQLPGIEVGGRSGLMSSSIEAGATTVFKNVCFLTLFVRRYSGQGEVN